MVDGGALLHKVRWGKGCSFGEITDMYTNYLRKNFRNLTIVFDGYEQLSTKDHEHARRCCVPSDAILGARASRLLNGLHILRARY